MPKQPFSIRTDAKIKAALKKAAAAEYRTITSLIEKILSDWLRANGYLEKHK